MNSIAICYNLLDQNGQIQGKPVWNCFCGNVWCSIIYCLTFTEIKCVAWIILHMLHVLRIWISKKLLSQRFHSMSCDIRWDFCMTRRNLYMPVCPEKLSKAIISSLSLLDLTGLSPSTNLWFRLKFNPRTHILWGFRPYVTFILRDHCNPMDADVVIKQVAVVLFLLSGGCLWSETGFQKGSEQLVPGRRHCITYNMGLVVWCLYKNSYYMKAG